jgi:hypothetical protein
VFQACHSFEEGRGLGLTTVEHVPVGVVARRILRPAAEFPPAEHVLETLGGELALQDFSIELWSEARMRLGTDIGDDVDARLLQQSHELG